MAATVAQLIDFLQGLTFRSIGNESAAAKYAKRNQLVDLVRTANPEALEVATAKAAEELTKYKELGERSRVFLAGQEAATGLVLSCEWDNLLHAEERAAERLQRIAELQEQLEGITINPTTPQAIKELLEQAAAAIKAELQGLGVHSVPLIHNL